MTSIKVQLLLFVLFMENKKSIMVLSQVHATGTHSSLSLSLLLVLIVILKYIVCSKFCTTDVYDRYFFQVLGMLVYTTQIWSILIYFLFLLYFSKEVKVILKYLRRAKDAKEK